MSEPVRRAREGGFILPGVVMFVLVLTIIGLSLFSLSSYEAQFMHQTLRKTEAFYEASSAIDRARFVLMSTKNLGDVSALSGTGNIEYAVAIQGNDSTGAVDWNSDDSVLVRVRVNKANEKRFLSAAFSPHSNPYDNLFSISAPNRGLFNYKSGTSDNLRVFLSGTVWQFWSEHHLPEDPEPDWYDDIYDTGSNNTFDVAFGNVPPPQMNTFWSTPLPAPGLQEWDKGIGHNDVTLDCGASGTVGFFHTGKEDSPYSKNIAKGNDFEIRVRGIAVWMLDGPLRVADKTKVMRAPGADGNDMLVLLSKKATDPANEDESGLDDVYGTEDIGFVFKGGISAPAPDNIPIIIVSNGYVAIDSKSSPQTSMSVDWLTIYANFVYLHGPTDEARTFSFSHLEGANAQAEANLQTLLNNGWLPNANPKRKSLSFIPGTWQELGTN